MFPILGRWVSLTQNTANEIKGWFQSSLKSTKVWNLFIKLRQKSKNLSQRLF